MNMETLLWFAGMWILGNFLYSLFGMQISISKQCAMKLCSLLSSNPQNWYPDACRKYWNGVIWKNRIILWVIATIVVCFAPLIGVIGYLVGIACKWLFTRGSVGLTENNIQDCIRIFVRFAKPGQEEAFANDFAQALDALAQNQMMRYV